jgi:segregation and condensation protein B
MINDMTSDDKIISENSMLDTQMEIDELVEEPAALTVTQQPVSATMLRRILEGAILAAGQPLTIARLLELFDEAVAPAADEVLAALQDIEADCRDCGYELKEVASGWRFQVREDLALWVNRLWEEKPQKYSRALLETLALIAYRQPITRGDIEEIRGVAVSSHIMKTLMERDWVKVVGHRDVPGRPSLYATTRQFLDYFNVKSLEDLPSLSEIRDLDEFNALLNLGDEEGLGEKDTDIIIGTTDENSSITDVNDLLEPEEFVDGEEAFEIREPFSRKDTDTDEEHNNAESL